MLSHSNPRLLDVLFFTVCNLCVFTLIFTSYINSTVSRNEITIRCYLVKFIVMYVICVYVCVYYLFFCMSLCMIVCQLYTLYSYLCTYFQLSCK